MPTVINRQPGGGGKPDPKPPRKPQAKPSPSRKGRAAQAAATAAQERTKMIALVAIILLAIGVMSVYLLTGMRRPPAASTATAVSTPYQSSGSAFGANLGAPGAAQGQGSSGEYGPHGRAGFEVSPDVGAPAATQEPDEEED